MHGPRTFRFPPGKTEQDICFKTGRGPGWQQWERWMAEWEEKAERRVICADNSSPGEERIPTEGWDAKGGPS